MESSPRTQGSGSAHGLPSQHFLKQRVLACKAGSTNTAVMVAHSGGILVFSDCTSALSCFKTWISLVGLRNGADLSRSIDAGVHVSNDHDSASWILLLTSLSIP